MEKCEVVTLSKGQGSEDPECTVGGQTVPHKNAGTCLGY